MANDLKKVEKNITDKVLNSVHGLVESGNLIIPSDYVPENAMKEAWLALQTVQDKDKKRALDTCNQTSIMNSLLDMVVQGLSPAKKQCYFIAYGKELQLQRSYFGTVAVAKRFSGIENVVANIIYKGDTFKYEIDPTTGNRIVKCHEQDFCNVDKANIVGGYAVVNRGEGLMPYVEIMTMEQIKQAWKLSKVSPVLDDGELRKGSTHEKFTEEMVKKTVINRACKMFVNSSSDKAVLAEAFNRTTDNEYDYSDKNVVSGDCEVVDEDTQQRAEAAVRAIVGDAEAVDPAEDTVAEPAEEVEAEAVENAQESEE